MHIIHVTHRDQVEPPFTDWLQEAYERLDRLAARKAKRSKGARPKSKRQ